MAGRAGRKRIASWKVDMIVTYGGGAWTLVFFFCW